MRVRHNNLYVGRGGRGTVFTTPGSYLQFDDRDSYIYIECIFISTDTNLRIYREVYSNYRYGYYDATKYHIIPSKTTPILVQVPQQLGNFEVSSRDLQLKTNDVIDRMDGTTIDRILTYNGSLENVDDLFSVTACYEFQLRIRNVSTTDIGNYTCSVTFQTRIFIARK
ncbi:unnamed protein product [Mytilus edulis]|uniref:Ig-like domain-containing protein n=1 Tax=Mytilus edulis TaxID=6550 RepID=A0A8S3SZK5_MYTED|nr:unnamed protein product [Mytilus edulis]